MAACDILYWGAIEDYYGQTWEDLCCYSYPTQTYDDFVSGVEAIYDSYCLKDRVFSNYVTQLYNNCLSGGSGGGSGATSFTVSGDNGTPFTITSGDTLQFVGLTGIDIGVSDPQVRVAIDYDGVDSFIMAAANGTSITVDGANDKLVIYDNDAAEVKYINANQISSTSYWSAGTDGTSITPSGGTTNTDIKLNGGLTAQTLNISGNTILGDNDKLMLGDANDLQIYHDGSNSIIQDNGTGHVQVRSGTFTILNAAGSKTSAIFNSGSEQAFYYDDTKKLETTSSGINVSGNTLVKNELGVSGRTYLGTIDAAGGSYSADKILVAQGDGEVEYLTTAQLKADIGDADYWTGNTDGTSITPSGGTTNTDIRLNGDIIQPGVNSIFNNGNYLEVGTGYANSAQLTFNANHDGGVSTNTYTPVFAGDSDAGMTVVKMPSGGHGGLDFYVKNHGTTSGSQNLSTFTKILELNQDGNSTFGGNILLGDGSVSDKYIGVGDAADLKIFHNGGHSIIRETGTGSLYLQSDNNVILSKDSSTEPMVKGIADGAVEVYYDNVKKFETTSTGINISGSTLNQGNLGVTGVTYSNIVSANTQHIASTLGVSGRTFLGTVDAASPTPTSTDKILVVQSTGEIESITKAQLTGFTENYWEEDGTGTGIKPSGATTNIKLGAGLTAQTINSSGNTHIGGDIFIAQTGKIKNASQTGTNIQFNNGQMLFDCNSVEMMRMTSTSGVVFNVGGAAALDFTIEGDTDPGLFFVDAGADKVAIGTTTVSDALLTVDGNTRISGDTFNKGNLGITGRTYLGTIDAAGGSYSEDKILVAQSSGEVEYLTTAQLKADIGDADYWTGNTDGTSITPSGGTTNTDIKLNGGLTAQTLNVSGNTHVGGQLFVSGTGENYIGGDINMIDSDIVIENSHRLIFENAAGTEFGQVLMNSSNNMIFQNSKTGGNVLIRAGGSGSGDTIFTTNQSGDDTVLFALRGDTARVEMSADTFVRNNIGISGRTFLGTVDAAGEGYSNDKILVQQSTGEIEYLTAAQLTTTSYWSANTDGTSISPSGSNVTTKVRISGDVEVAEYIKHLGDSDTYIQFADDSIGINAGGEQLITISETPTFVKIGDGGDVDFQVRTNSDDNTLYVEGSTDNVGIGTNTPTAKLEVTGGVNISGTTRIPDDQKILLGDGEDTEIYQTGSETIIKDASTGNIKLRAGTVTIQNGAASKTMAVFNGANSVDLHYNNNLKLQTALNGINVTGWVQASTDVNVSGNTNINGTLSAMGNTTLSGGLGVGTASPTTAGLIRATNDVVAYYSSDKRLKDNVIPITNALDKLDKINGVEFDWIPKEGIHENEGHDVGVIAQEVEDIIPEIVQTRDNGYKAVRYEKLVPVLIQSIKELKKEIEELKNK